jgi:uncharacterized protein (TIGR03435 family)
MTTTDLAGWTLLHFLWQGAIVAGIAAVALRSLSSAQWRYAVACTALLAMLAAPLVTAGVLSGRDDASISLQGSPTAAVATAPVASVLSESIRPLLTAPTDGANSSVSPFEPRSLMPLVVTAWLAGVALLLARLAGGCWRVRRLRAFVFTEPVSRWQAAADAIARRLRLTRPIMIVDSDRVDTPTVIGWLRPIVILPIAAMSNLAPVQVDAILAHELAHIRRHDFLVNLLQTAAETLLFYHPAVWWISGRIRAEREHCCDDVAVEVCGDPVTYAEALTELAARSLTTAPLALAATGGSLLARVRRLLHVSPDATARTSSRMLVAGLAVALVIVVGTVRAITVAQSPDTSGGRNDDGRFGPRDVNRLLGFELFPGPEPWPPGDPRGARAWGVTVRYATGEMPIMGSTARNLIRDAYGTRDMSIVNAPRWLDEETFDLSIDSPLTVAAGIADPESVNASLRELFDRHLGLVVHREQRELPVYALVKANADGRLGPNIAPSTNDCFDARDPGRRVLSRRVCGIEDNLTGIRAASVTFAEFAAAMRPTTPLAPKLPLVDRTGLTGRYDFRLRFGLLPIAAIGSRYPFVGAAIAPLGFRSFDSAVEEQLGLTLHKTTAPFEVLVIDHIQRPSS